MVAQPATSAANDALLPRLMVLGNHCGTGHASRAFIWAGGKFGALSVADAGMTAVGGIWRSVVLLPDSAGPELSWAEMALRLVQTLSGLSPPPRLMVLTTGSQVPRRLGRTYGMRGAALGGCWGLARVVRLELSPLHVLCADVDGAEAAAALRGSPKGDSIAGEKGVLRPEHGFVLRSGLDSLAAVKALEARGCTPGLHATAA